MIEIRRFDEIGVQFDVLAVRLGESEGSPQECRRQVVTPEELGTVSILLDSAFEPREICAQKIGCSFTDWFVIAGAFEERVVVESLAIGCLKGEGESICTLDFVVYASKAVAGLLSQRPARQRRPAQPPARRQWERGRRHCRPKRYPCVTVAVRVHRRFGVVSERNKETSRECTTGYDRWSRPQPCSDTKRPFVTVTTATSCSRFEKNSGSRSAQ